MSQLLSHSRGCAGLVCEFCLESLVKHCADDTPQNWFKCPSLDVRTTGLPKLVPKTRVFGRKRDFDSRFYSDCDGKLVSKATLLRVLSRIESNKLFQLVDSRVHVSRTHLSTRVRRTRRYKYVFHSLIVLYCTDDLNLSLSLDCCRCSWGACCDGCEVARNGILTLNDSDSLCVAFETTAPVDTRPEDQKSEQLNDNNGDPAVDEDNSEKPLDLDQCLRAFADNECLSDGQYVCGECGGVEGGGGVRPPGLSE